MRIVGTWQFCQLAVLFSKCSHGISILFFHTPSRCDYLTILRIAASLARKQAGEQGEAEKVLQFLLKKVNCRLWELAERATAAFQSVAFRRSYLPIYRFSYQEEQNSLFHDSLRAPTHVKLVWNIASSGDFGFRIFSVLPLCSYIWLGKQHSSHPFGMGNMAFPVCLILGWNDFWIQLGSPLRTGLSLCERICYSRMRSWRVCMCENTLSYPSGPWDSNSEILLLVESISWDLSSLFTLTAALCLLHFVLWHHILSGSQGGAWFRRRWGWDESNCLVPSLLSHTKADWRKTFQSGQMRTLPRSAWRPMGMRRTWRYQVYGYEHCMITPDRRLMSWALKQVQKQ